MTPQFSQARHFGRIAALLLSIPMLSSFLGTEVLAQSSSLVGRGAKGRPLTMAGHSWTYRRLPEPEPIRKNDLVTVLVDYKTQVISEGEIDRKKKADGTLTLQDWILLKGFWAVPDPQSLGDPTISGKMDNKLKAEASIESLDTMKLSIACRVADIRPNGNLILEGHRTMRNNHEQWDISLTGEVRPDDVSPANTIDSDAIADLNVYKREAGHVRDGYRRGWFLKWLDLIQPF